MERIKNKFPDSLEDIENEYIRKKCKNEVEYDFAIWEDLVLDMLDFDDLVGVVDCRGWLPGEYKEADELLTNIILNALKVKKRLKEECSKTHQLSLFE